MCFMIGFIWGVCGVNFVGYLLMIVIILLFYLKFCMGVNVTSCDLKVDEQPT